MNIPIPIINRSPHELPQYQTDGSSGMDLRAWLPGPVTVAAGARILVPTGLYMALPDGYEAQIRPRSGMAVKKGITVVNAPGTIDSDYRGEIKIALINLSHEAQTIEDGERIAQMIVAKYDRAAWTLVEELDETKRGAGGFGHSGTN